MRNRAKQSGITLTEITFVTAIVALLTVLGLPAVRMFSDSLASVGDGRAMISAAMASTRALAAREQKYVGLRFQTEYDENGPLEASQYMTFIIHDYKNLGLVNGFRAVEGLEPIKLPDGIGVMDLRVRNNTGNETVSKDRYIAFNNDINNDYELRDTMTFSIIFSPAGKLVVRPVRVRNRKRMRNRGDYYKGYRPENLNDSRDDIFNSPINIVDNETGMFVQDDWAYLGLGQEYSRRCFIIYDRRDFEQVDSGERYSEFLKRLKNKFMIYINPYTGLMLENYVESN